MEITEIKFLTEADLFFSCLAVAILFRAESIYRTLLLSNLGYQITESLKLWSMFYSELHFDFQCISDPLILKAPLPAEWVPWEGKLKELKGFQPNEIRTGYMK